LMPNCPPIATSLSLSKSILHILSSLLDFFDSVVAHDGGGSRFSTYNV